MSRDDIIRVMQIVDKANALLTIMVNEDDNDDRADKVRVLLVDALARMLE